MSIRKRAINRKWKPEAVSQTVKAVLRNLGVDRVLERHSIWSHWEEIVGQEVAGHTQPEFFSGASLFITVDHSAWMHQLTFLKDQILSNINTKLGSQAVSEIRFRLGTVPVRLRPSQEEPLQESWISQTDQDEIQESVRHINCPELREALSRVMAKDLAQKQSFQDESRS